jgi:hypothetical protein
METVMTDKPRDTAGKFAPKSETPRRIRSVNLTDDAWQWLAAEAQKAGMSRNDYLEVLASGNNPLMETAEAESLPLMETVEAESLPLMETVEAKIEAGGVNIAQQPNSQLLPFIETVGTENQRLHMELSNLQVENEALKKEVQRLLLALELPEAPNLLNQLKAKRKKTTASLADIEAILEIIEES